MGKPSQDMCLLQLPTEILNYICSFLSMEECAKLESVSFDWRRLMLERIGSFSSIKLSDYVFELASNRSKQQLIHNFLCKIHSSLEKIEINNSYRDITPWIIQELTGRRFPKLKTLSLWRVPPVQYSNVTQCGSWLECLEMQVPYEKRFNPPATFESDLCRYLDHLPLLKQFSLYATKVEYLVFDGIFLLHLPDSLEVLKLGIQQARSAETFNRHLACRNWCFLKVLHLQFFLCCPVEIDAALFPQLEELYCGSPLQIGNLNLLKSLRTVDLVGRRYLCSLLSNILIRECCFPATLKSLHLTPCTDIAVESLTDISTLSSLESLSLQYSPKTTISMLRKISQGCKNLKELSLYRSNIDDMIFTSIPEIFQKLTTLDVFSSAEQWTVTTESLQKFIKTLSRMRTIKIWLKNDPEAKRRIEDSGILIAYRNIILIWS